MQGSNNTAGLESTVQRRPQSSATAWFCFLKHCSQNQMTTVEQRYSEQYLRGEGGIL